MPNEATAMERQELIMRFRSAMEQFTAEDFIDGDAPYILLDEAASDPETRARFELILKRRAKELRIPMRTVDEIIKARDGNLLFIRPTSNDKWIDWDGQPLTIRSGRYDTENNSVSYEDKYGTQVVCPHPIMPTKRFINIDTGTESLEISFRREDWKSIVINKGTLSSASTVIQLADHGVSVTSETAREMVKYLQYIDDLNRDLIPIEKMSSHLGWINGTDFVPYVDGVQYDSAGQFVQMYKTIGTNGSFDKWLEVVKQVRKDGTKQARITLAASFASVLLSLFDALPFVVHLWSSQSGTGKTVAMEIAASVWANPQVGAYCRTLKSTTVGLEQLAIFTCNLPLCLDELQTIQDKKNFDDIIYSLCEGSGKTRGAKNGGIRQSPTWKNAIITTGEMPIVGSASKAGAMNRVLEIECEGQVMPDAKTVHRTISANYGYAGKMFLDGLKNEEVRQYMENEQLRMFDALSSVGTDKQALSASILLVADHMAERIIFKDGIMLTVDDVLEYLRTNDDVDTGRRAHDYITEWIAENKNGFIVDNNMEDFNGRAVLGCAETDEKGNLSKIWIINKAFTEMMQSGGFSPDSYLSWAKGRNLLIRNGAGTGNKTVKRIPGIGITARCVGLDFEGKTEEQIEWTVVNDAQLPF